MRRSWKSKNCLQHLQLIVKLNDVHVKCTKFKKANIFFWTMSKISFLSLDRWKMFYKQYGIHFGCANEQNDQYKNEYFQKIVSLSLVTQSWDIYSTFVCHLASWAWFMKVNWILIWNNVHARYMVYVYMQFVYISWSENVDN